jgi:nicotinamidase/pyrazinamidase
LQDTPLHDRHFRAALKVGRLFIGGLATDYCVLEHGAGCAGTRVRGVRAGRMGSRPVNVLPDDGRRAEEAMVQAGAIPLCLERLAA